MRRVGPWTASLIAHAIACAIWFACHTASPGPAPHRTAIELVDVVAVPRVVETAPAAGGGGDPGTPAASPLRREPARHHRPQARAAEPVQREPAAPPAPPASAPPAAIQPSPSGAAAPGTGGGGDGGGQGTGHGAGTGPGTGSATQVPAEPPSRAFDRMVAAPRSRARPARLIYPIRERAEEADRLVIAILTVDSDGAVVGAKLEHGPGGLVQDKAMAAVWRFYYSPALDDAGRPIRSKVEQRFMLE